MNTRMKTYALLLFCLACAHAQPSFDVVSIHPPAPSGQSDVEHPMLGDLMGATYRFDDRVRFRAITVLQLLQQAYDVKYIQIIGPGWLSAERFDIAATYAINPSPEDFRTMLRALLTERFGLQLHHETRSFDAYRLVQAKEGHKLSDPVPEGRGSYGMPIPGGFKEVGRGMPMHRLAATIEYEFALRGEKAVLVDQTGLEGAFDFEITFTRNDTLPTPSPYPSLFHALEHDLGLRLEKSKVPLDTLIVDRIERRPTDN